MIGAISVVVAANTVAAVSHAGGQGISVLWVLVVQGLVGLVALAVALWYMRE